MDRPKIYYATTNNLIGMSLELEDGRWSTLWRYNDKSLANATQILALSNLSIVDREPAYNLRVRWEIQIQDTMHDFCYTVRKAIEISEKVGSGAQSEAADVSLHSEAEGLNVEIGPDEEIELCDRSFWWVINRIIHSREAKVQERSEILVGEPWGLPHQTSSRLEPKYFAFRSDYDDEGDLHYISIERLVNIFISRIEPMISNELEEWREDPFHL